MRRYGEHVALPIGLRALSTAIDVGAPTDPLPTEVRLFKWGINTTENGYSVLFDDAAAAAVMAHAAKHGVDVMIDLEHDSINEMAIMRSDSKDARGRGRLEVRPKDGLYLVSISWTEDGAERLRSRKQTYVSPAFPRDDKTGRPLGIVNVALTSLPATDHAVPLMAASLTGYAKVAARARAASYVRNARKA